MAQGEVCPLSVYRSVPLSVYTPAQIRQVAELVGQWKPGLHSRAFDLYKLDDILTTIARNIPKGQESILARGSEGECILWLGGRREWNGTVEGIVTIEQEGGTHRVFF